MIAFVWLVSAVAANQALGWWVIMFYMSSYVMLSHTTSSEPLTDLPAACMPVIKLWLPVVQVYIIEANPRASRTVPFVAKAIGHPIAKYASLIMSGQTLKDLNFTEEPVLNHVAVKEAVLPFDKFPGKTSTSPFQPTRQDRSTVLSFAFSQGAVNFIANNCLLCSEAQYARGLCGIPCQAWTCA